MDTLAPAPAPPRRPRVSLWLLRAVVTLHVAAVACQPVLAGLFLSGDVAAIDAHSLVATLLLLLSLLTAAVAVGYLTAGRGARWVLPAAVALFLLDGVQVGFGYARALGVHLPLGVAIVTVSVLLAVWVWTPWAARART